MGKNSRSESGINIPDHFFEGFRNNFWVKILKFFDADPGIRNLFDLGSRIRDGKNSHLPPLDSPCTVEITSVADPDPGSGAFLTPVSGMGKKSGSGSGMKTPYFRELRNNLLG
jgi:hypothetical protein